MHGKVREGLHWLFIEWPRDAAEPTKYGLSTLPEDTPLRELVWWATLRWWIEQNSLQWNEELGLDHFEGRTWPGGHRHVTLTMIAFDFLVTETVRGKKTLGWTLPQLRREIQLMLIHLLGFCPLCRRPTPEDIEPHDTS